MSSSYEVEAQCSTQQGRSVSVTLAVVVGDGVEGPTDDLITALRDATKSLVGTYTADNAPGIDYAHTPTASAKETGLTRTLS